MKSPKCSECDSRLVTITNLITGDGEIISDRYICECGNCGYSPFYSLYTHTNNQKYPYLYPKTPTKALKIYKEITKKETKYKKKDPKNIDNPNSLLSCEYLRHKKCKNKYTDSINVSNDFTSNLEKITDKEYSIFKHFADGDYSYSYNYDNYKLDKMIARDNSIFVTIIQPNTIITSLTDLRDIVKLREFIHEDIAYTLMNNKDTVNEWIKASNESRAFNKSLSLKIKNPLIFVNNSYYIKDKENLLKIDDDKHICDIYDQEYKYSLLTDIANSDIIYLVEEDNFCYKHLKDMLASFIKPTYITLNNIPGLTRLHDTIFSKMYISE